MTGKIFPWKDFSHRKRQLPCFLLALFTCVFVARSDAASLGVGKISKKSGSGTFAGVCALGHFSFLFLFLLAAWVCIVTSRCGSCSPSFSDEVLQSCVALPSVRVIRWYVATENNCWVCLCGAAAFVRYCRVSSKPGRQAGRHVVTLARPRWIEM